VLSRKVGAARLVVKRIRGGPRPSVSPTTLVSGRAPSYRRSR